MKIPEPRKLKSGNWHVQLRLDGESISITRATETECRREAQLIKAQHEAGVRETLSRSVRDLTLREAQELFLAAHRSVLSPSTVRSYESYIKHRWPDYRDKPLAKIQWQAMINGELALPVSAKTLRNAWALVGASLKNAGYPVPQVKLAAVPVRELNYLRPEEIAPFCDAICGKSYEIAALLLLHGLRVSEVLGLDWKNIKLDKKEKAGTITVSGAVVRGPGGLTAKETNKNRSSTRKVPIMIPRLYEAFKAVQAQSGPVVDIHPTNLLDDVKRACMAAGTTVCGCHDLRRSFLSLCYHLGISERQAMAWGGYSDIRTMHQHYIRLSEGDSSRDAETVRAFFKNANKRSRQTKKDQ